MPHSCNDTNRRCHSNPTTSNNVPVSNESRIVSAQIRDKSKGKAVLDVIDWTVEDVTNWLRGEGFGKGICDKFTANAVQGKVLMALDHSILKYEIGIVPWGERYMIMEAIDGLRSEGQPKRYADDSDEARKRRRLADSDLGARWQYTGYRFLGEGEQPYIFLAPAPHMIKLDQTPQMIAKSISKASEIHKRIKAIPSDQDFSDPVTFTWLPFPSLLHVPNRFTKCESDGALHFQYMGRSKFRDLDTRCLEPNFADSSERLCVYGTSGSGKSHILAAFVCHLIRTGHRVVYIPDCFRLLEHPAWVIWNALLFAFHDSEDLDAIRDRNDVDALVAFMLRYPNLYVIVDQRDALEFRNGNDEHADKKIQVRDWLDQMKIRHRYIFSASANEISSQDANQTQSGIAVFEVLGGMTQDETAQWFVHHQARIPDLSCFERLSVEHITGNIPLLLNSLIDAETFNEEEFMRSPVLRKVNDDIKTFFRRKERDLTDIRSRNLFIDIIKACLQHQLIRVDDRSLYDLRYFYVDADRVGHYTCGIAFITMMRELRIRTEQFCHEEWYATVRASCNPVVQGFMAEDICLAAIGKDGLSTIHDQLHQMSTAIFAVKPDWNTCIHSEHIRYLYIPSTYTFKAVDGIILLLDRNDMTAHIFPIQITLSMRKRDSDEVFYTTTWYNWVASLEDAGYTVQSTFVYVDKKQPTSQLVPEVIKKLRRKEKLVHPEYKRVHVGVNEVDRRLASALGIM